MQPDVLPRVLCVDDNEDSREMLSLLLNFSQMEAIAVGTADQALSLIQAECFDLYLLDSRLPEIDGFELCRRLRDIDGHTPILFFSGAAYETDKQKGIEAGANAYVVKPDVEGLLGTINQFVRPVEYVAAQKTRPRPSESPAATFILKQQFSVRSPITS